MDAEIEKHVAAIAEALARLELSHNEVLGLEKKLEIARLHESTAQRAVITLSDTLKTMLHPPSGKAMGDIYREQGVEGYEDWKRR